MDVEQLKKEYAKLGKSYKLPSFKELNEEFEIDKIERESDCLLRIIRKVMMEKIVNSLGFLELILNPVNAPRIYLNFIKSVDSIDKENIEKIYSAFSELSIGSIELEIDYSEKREAEMVKKIFESWNSVKPDFKAIITSMKRPGAVINRKEKSYFG